MHLPLVWPLISPLQGPMLLKEGELGDGAPIDFTLMVIMSLWSHVINTDHWAAWWTGRQEVSHFFDKATDFYSVCALSNNKLEAQNCSWFSDSGNSFWFLSTTQMLMELLVDIVLGQSRAVLYISTDQDWRRPKDEMQIVRGRWEYYPVDGILLEILPQKSYFNLNLGCILMKTNKHFIRGE